MTRTRFPALIAATFCVPPLGVAAAQDQGPPAALQAPAPALNPQATVTTGQMTHFLQRPLFSATRRPYSTPPLAAAAPPPAPAAPSASHIRLVGTLSIPGGSSALIEDTSRGITHTVPAGGTVDGWRVSEIRASGVSIEQGGQRVELDMFKPGEPAPPPRTAQAAPALRPPEQQPAAPQTAGAPPPPPARSATGTAPAGTMPGTAAAEIATNSPHRLIFGGPPKAGTP